VKVVEIAAPGGLCQLFEDGSVFLEGKPYTLPAGSTYHGIGVTSVAVGQRVYWTDTAGPHSVDLLGGDLQDHTALDTKTLAASFPANAPDKSKPVIAAA
jgi:hypothetical protein